MAAVVRRSQNEKRDILAQFQQSITTLNERIEASVTANNANKKGFAKEVIRKLTEEVQPRIAALGDGIKQLKGQLDTLNKTRLANTTQIDQHNANIKELEGRLLQREGELQQATERVRQLSDEATVKDQALEQERQRYVALEGEHRNLTAERDALILERDNLTAQLQAQQAQMTGDHQQATNVLTAQHAQEIQQHAAQIQQLQQDIQARQNDLDAALAENHRLTGESAQRVQDLTAESAGRQTQIENLTRELDALAQARDQLNGQIADLERQVTELTTENDDLIERIIQATTAIATATTALRRIELNNPADFDQDQLDETFNNIEVLIRNISGSLAGNNPGDNNNRPPKVPKGPVLPPNTVINFKGADYQLGFIISELERKGKQVAGRDKYDDAKNEILTADTPQEVIDILNKNNINFKNGAISGGKKGKKNKTKRKKQKGGFIYSQHTKRRSLSTPLGRGITRRHKSKSHRSKRHKSKKH